MKFQNYFNNVLKDSLEKIVVTENNFIDSFSNKIKSDFQSFRNKELYQNYFLDVLAKIKKDFNTPFGKINLLYSDLEKKESLIENIKEFKKEIHHHTPKILREKRGTLAPRISDELYGKLSSMPRKKINEQLEKTEMQYSKLFTSIKDILSEFGYFRFKEDHWYLNREEGHLNLNWIIEEIKKNIVNGVHQGIEKRLESEVNAKINLLNTLGEEVIKNKNFKKILNLNLEKSLNSYHIAKKIPLNSEETFNFIVKSNDIYNLNELYEFAGSIYDSPEEIKNCLIAKRFVLNYNDDFKKYNIAKKFFSDKGLIRKFIRVISLDEAEQIPSLYRNIQNDNTKFDDLYLRVFKKNNKNDNLMNVPEEMLYSLLVIGAKDKCRELGVDSFLDSFRPKLDKQTNVMPNPNNRNPYWGKWVKDYD